MDELMKTVPGSFTADLEQIFASNQPDLVRFEQGFKRILEQILSDSHNEIELRRALHDREGLIKEQIKLSTLQYAGQIFDYCRQQVQRHAAQKGKLA